VCIMTQVERAPVKSRSVRTLRNGGYKLAGKFPTNLKHLKKHHLLQYQAVVWKEEEMKKKETAKNVQDITFKQYTNLESFQGNRSYNKESDRYKLITKKLAIFIGSTNVAIGLVENPKLRSLIETLDPRYQVPGRALIEAGRANGRV